MYKKFIILSLFFLVLIIIGIVAIVINSNKLDNIANPNKNKSVTIIQNENLNVGKTTDNSAYYGESVSTLYDSNKQYKEYTLYGDFNYSAAGYPIVSLAYSDDGKIWNLSGSSEHSSFTDIENETTKFMIKYQNKTQFNFVTFFVAGEVNNFNCYIKMST